MEKNFDSWNIEKKKIHNQETKVLFHEREIWWCSIGLNIGDEQDGKNELFERPVLVIKKFNNRLAWVLPLSTKAKAGPYYFIFNHDGKDFSVILSQLRLVSGYRFQRRIRKIRVELFDEILTKLVGLLRK